MFRNLIIQHMYTKMQVLQKNDFDLFSLKTPILDSSLIVQRHYFKSFEKTFKMEILNPYFIDLDIALYNSNLLLDSLGITDGSNVAVCFSIAKLLV